MAKRSWKSEERHGNPNSENKSGEAVMVMAQENSQINANNDLSCKMTKGDCNVNG